MTPILFRGIARLVEQAQAINKTKILSDYIEKRKDGESS